MSLEENKEAYRKRYMELYEQAQALFDEYNPCSPGPDNHCTRTRLDPQYETKRGDRCCGGCQHHSPEEGCKTISLSCKVWLCGMLTSMAFSNKYPRLREFYDKLWEIQRQVSKLHPYPGCRQSLDSSLRLVEGNYIEYNGGEDGTEKPMHFRRSAVNM